MGASPALYHEVMPSDPSRLSRAGRVPRRTIQSGESPRRVRASRPGRPTVACRERVDGPGSRWSNGLGRPGAATALIVPALSCRFPRTDPAGPLHRETDHLMRPEKTSIERRLPLSTDAALRRRFMVINEPIPGNLRFGLLLEFLDRLAEDAALTYARRSAPEARVVTAAIDDIVIVNPADVTRDLVLLARINSVGRTSMEVGIRIEQPGPEPAHVASCYFTMVARVGEGDATTSVPVEPLDYVSAQEEHGRARALERRASYRESLAAAAEPPSREEYELLARLHEAQEAPGFPARSTDRLAGQLVTSNWERMFPDQENVPASIFGGYIVRRAYELASIHAEEIAPRRPVPVRVSRINFLQPVRIGDKLHFTSRIVYTGHTSIWVEVDIQRISRDRVTRALSNTCAFTFVNVDRTMEPQPVPVVHPTTYAEDRRYLEAYRRHQRFRKEDAVGED